MRAVIAAAVVAFLVTILLTPVAIRGFTRIKAGQPIRTDGPQTHLIKTGTPTMGGVVIILATVIAYVVGHFVLATLPPNQLPALLAHRDPAVPLTSIGVMVAGSGVQCERHGVRFVPGRSGYDHFALDGSS